MRWLSIRRVDDGLAVGEDVAHFGALVKRTEPMIWYGIGPS
jgi:hypothetical protein